MREIMNERHSGFHMVQLDLDVRKLVQLGRMLHLPLARTDNNYLTHCALSELFQAQAPTPFCVEDVHRSLDEYDQRGDRYLRVLGYSDVEGQALQRIAQGFASPAVYEICSWDRLASKPMPDIFPEGMHLAFQLRACPVVRKASDGPKWNRGQEVDAYLSRVWELDDPTVDVDREDVYRDWLKAHLERRGGAEPLAIGMNRFSIERMTRRTHGKDRKVRTIQRPDVTLTGTLRITNARAFTDALRAGVGRHKSFGYGMLKIRRA